MVGKHFPLLLLPLLFSAALLLSSTANVVEARRCCRFNCQHRAWVPIPEPWKNSTVVELVDFAVGVFNDTMQGSLRCKSVVEASVRTNCRGTSMYLMAVQAEEPTGLLRIYRADVMQENPTGTELLRFSPVLGGGGATSNWVMSM